MSELLRFVDLHPWLSFFAGAGVFALIVLLLLTLDNMWLNFCRTWELKAKRERSKKDEA